MLLRCHRTLLGHCGVAVVGPSARPPVLHLRARGLTRGTAMASTSAAASMDLPTQESDALVYEAVIWANQHGLVRNHALARPT